MSVRSLQVLNILLQGLKHAILEPKLPVVGFLIEELVGQYTKSIPIIFLVWSLIKATNTSDFPDVVECS